MYCPSRHSFPYFHVQRILNLREGLLVLSRMRVICLGIGLLGLRALVHLAFLISARGTGQIIGDRVHHAG